MLDNLFGSKTRAKLLTLFFNNIDNCFYVREITRNLKENINSIRREILNLEKIGILKEANPADYNDSLTSEQAKDQENKKFYSVNKEYTLYNELHNLVIRSRLLVDKKLLDKLKEIKSIKLIILKGMFVGDESARTDILIIGNADKTKIRRVISSMEQNFEIPIRYTIMTQKEFDYRNSMTDKFLFEIMENKKVILIDRR